MKKKYRIQSKFRFTLFLIIILISMISITGTAVGFNMVDSLTKINYAEIEIESGDTLWNLAKEFGPKDKDVRKIVYQICKTNHISADSIYPGQTILIPEFI